MNLYISSVFDEYQCKEQILHYQSLNIILLINKVFVLAVVYLLTLKAGSASSCPGLSEISMTHYNQYKKNSINK